MSTSRSQQDTTSSRLTRRSQRPSKETTDVGSTITNNKTASPTTTPSNPQTILITGCSDLSLGSALALTFASHNFNVHATARSLSRLTFLTNHPNIHLHELDTTSTASITALATNITHLDILFNNAGIAILSPVLDASAADYRQMYEVNVIGPMLMAQAFMPLLIANKGVLINHTSQAGYNVNPYSGGYCASKAAMAALNTAMRMEFQPLGVQVVELVTGIAESNITETQMGKSRFEGGEGSYYWEVRGEYEKVTGKRSVEKVKMGREEYARRVVGSLVDKRMEGRVKRRLPKWMWEGGLATVLWVLWWVSCCWKGVADGLGQRATGLHLLEKRRREAGKGV